MKKIFKIAVVCLVVFLLVVVKGSHYMENDLQVENEVYQKYIMKGSCAVLSYHRVREYNLWYHFIQKLTDSDELSEYSIYKEDFENQINELLNQGYYFASLDEVMEYKKTGDFPDKCILLTFDDVDRSVYDNAFPVLKEKKIPFCLFVIAGQVGNKNYNNLEMATWEQLQEMVDSGLATIGSHTYDMHELKNNKAEYLDSSLFGEFKQDLIKSRKVLSEQLGVEVKSFAYPFGVSIKEVEKIVEECGFEEAFILSPNIIDYESDDFALSRYMITSSNFDHILQSWK